MDLGEIAKGVERLSEADAVIADHYVHTILNRVGVNALAGIVGLCALALWELAAFWLLEPRVGLVLAAALLGAINFMSAVLLLLGMTLKPQSAELALALKLRRSAISQMQQELTSHKNGSSYTVRPVIELLVALLVPMVAALVRSVRTHPGRTDRSQKVPDLLND